MAKRKRMRKPRDRKRGSWEGEEGGIESGMPPQRWHDARLVLEGTAWSASVCSEGIGCVSAEQQRTGVLIVARRTVVARRDSVECVCMQR